MYGIYFSENIGENIIYMWVEQIREFVTEKAGTYKCLKGKSIFKITINIVACQAHPALVKRSGVRIVFISLSVR